MVRKLRMKRLFLFSSLLFALLILLNANSFAATFNPTTVAELIADITTANSNGEDDEINLVEGMVYTITDTEPGVPFTDFGNSGLPTIGADSGNNLTINGNGATIQRDPSLVIDIACSGTGLKFRLLLVEDANLILNDTTLLNGCASGTTAEEDSGGALNIRNSIVTINNSTISSNGAVFEAAIFLSESTVRIFNSALTDNRTFANCGVISTTSNSQLSILNTTVSGNASGTGGVCASASTGIKITNSTITNNALGGTDAALSNLGGRSATIEVKSSLITNNSNNDPMAIGGNCLGSILDLGGNISDDDTDSCAPSFNPDWNNFTMLGLLDDNGGDTLTHALLETTGPANPAIDTILPVDCTDQQVAPAPVTDDQRFFTRPFNVNCDVGAFELQPAFTLTIDLAGTGEGNVHAPGIDCGDGSTDCRETYFTEINVVLMASASPGYVFEGFTGDPDCEDGIVVMDSNKNCIATFNPPPVALNVTLAGTGSGVVTSTPAGINCGSDCSELYPEGTQVTMTPTPAPGSVFSGFSGDLDCTNGIVDLIAERNCIATFNEVQTGDLTLNVIDPGTAGGTSVISAENATPTGNVAFVWSFNLGTTVIGGPTCNGLVIDLVNPRLLPIVTAGGDGIATLNVFIPQFNPMEVTILTQAIDVESCNKSDVVTNILQN